MAACCTTALGGSFLLGLRSNGRLQECPATRRSCCCCARAFQQSSFAEIGDRLLVLTNKSRALRRRRSSWRQNKVYQQVQLQTDLSFSSVAAHIVSCNAAFGGEGTSIESGMSLEEKEAILAFGGLSTDAATAEEEQGNSVESTQLGSSEEEKGQKGTPSEDAGKVQRRPEMYDPRPKVVKGKGSGIASVINMFVALLDRPDSGNGRLIAGAGSAFLERIEGDVEKLRGVEGVNGQYLFEILRVVKLVQMDLHLIAGARRDSTLLERLNQTKAHCRQLLEILAIL